MGVTANPIAQVVNPWLCLQFAPPSSQGGNGMHQVVIPDSQHIDAFDDPATALIAMQVHDGIKPGRNEGMNGHAIEPRSQTKSL